MKNMKIEEMTLSDMMQKSVDDLRDGLKAIGVRIPLTETATENECENDAVHSPSRYKIPGTGTEVIDIIQGILSPEQFRGYCYGNVIKYILRAPSKGGAEDIGKASVYLDWLVLELKDEDCSSADYGKGYEDGYDEACMDLLEDGDLVRREDVTKMLIERVRNKDENNLRDAVSQIPAATKWKE